MPTIKELTIRLEDQPGTLGKVCRALAEHKVNVLALQSMTVEGRGLVRFVADDSTAAKKVLDNEGVGYEETDVVQARLTDRPGELARTALRLGNADINIDYVYCGVDPSTNAPLLIFGVKDVGQAAMLLDRPAAA